MATAEREDENREGAAGASSRGTNETRQEKVPLAQMKKRPVAPKPSNDFLCVPKYFCQPPEPKMDLKLIDFEPDLSYYASYRSTELDLSRVRPMFADPTYGVRVNLVDLEEYKEYKEGEGPLEEDLALLESDGDAGDGSIRRKTSASAPFLRAMFYDEYKIDKIDYSGAKSKAERSKKRSREDLLASVESEFQAAKKKPVYPDPSKSHLEPVEVLPVFPDFNNQYNRYVVVRFEDDPVSSIGPALERNLDREEPLNDADAKEMANSVVTRGNRGEDNEPYLSLYAPVDDEIEKRKENRHNTGSDKLQDRYGTADSEDYHLVKEYVFDVRARETAPEVQCLYLLSKNKDIATYTEVSSRLALHKRLRSQRANLDEAPKTQRLILKRVPMDSADRAEKIEAIMQMCVGDETAELANALEQ
eukprot:Plantae.Rhodophyta-Purpureofilum_apyrenoidigerum.ctg12253.p1 GENE.Plantae.Rhodophyta-Purpureofilum_apyrenoidigerum.ctg12253~~Plantae.Rhodophyta-Purpureofilum_apyrenoidigerum.ctg12253.p1  ORF type:complete len:418 (-),score=99.46 Plantae.Rhodophyta-Purpureofilum_apyrenoidigerum.ctg12253:139-1392(-)